MGWIQRSELEEVAKASEGKPIKAACSTLCSFGALWRPVLYNQVVEVKWLPHPLPRPAKCVTACQNQLWPVRRQNCPLFNCQFKCFLTTAALCSAVELTMHRGDNGFTALCVGLWSRSLPTLVQWIELKIKQSLKSDSEGMHQFFEQPSFKMAKTHILWGFHGWYQVKPAPFALAVEPKHYTLFPSNTKPSSSSFHDKLAQYKVSLRKGGQWKDVSTLCWMYSTKYK